MEISNIKSNRVISEKTYSSNARHSITVGVDVKKDDLFFSVPPSEWDNESIKSSSKQFHERVYNEVEYPPLPPQEWVQKNVENTLLFLNSPNPIKTNWLYSRQITLLKTYYSPKTDAIYTGIPKAGCTNWKFTLLKLEGRFAKNKPSPMVHYAINHLSLAQKIYSYNRNFLNSKYTFTVIRNPWTRMVSGYNDKFGKGRILKKWQKGRVALQILQKHRSPKLSIADVEFGNVAPTFMEFIEHLAYDPIIEINAHFRPQYAMLSLSTVVFDFIGALEYAKEQSRVIFDHFKTTSIGNVSIPGPYDSSTDPRNERSSVLAAEWLKEVPPSLIEKLYNKFKPDFMIYNYSNFSDSLFPFPLYNSDDIFREM